MGSGVGAQGLTAPLQLGSAPDLYQTSVPCVARWILNHWNSREAQEKDF